MEGRGPRTWGGTFLTEILRANLRQEWGPELKCNIVRMLTVSYKVSRRNHWTCQDSFSESVFKSSLLKRSKGVRVYFRLYLYSVPQGRKAKDYRVLQPLSEPQESGPCDVFGGGPEGKKAAFTSHTHTLTNAHARTFFYRNSICLFGMREAILIQVTGTPENLSISPTSSSIQGFLTRGRLLP